MKTKLTFLLVFISLGTFAQEILIPYKSGNKFGLCDENAKVILEPRFDHIDYLEKDYFRFGSRETGRDSFLNQYGDTIVEEREISTFGLLKRDHLLIPAQPLGEFIIYDHFIAVTDNPYQPENFFLYNLKGEKVAREQFKGMDVNDERDLGHLANASERYTLLSIFHDVRRNGDRPFSIVVYDNLEQKIHGWLLREVLHYEARYSLSGPDYTYCTYTDHDGDHDKFIRYRNGQFDLVDQLNDPGEPPVFMQLQAPVQEFPEIVEIGEEYGEKYGEVPPARDSPSDDPGPGRGESPRRNYTYYSMRNDSLFYFGLEEKIFVALPKKTEVFPMHTGTLHQSGPMIYKKGNKFGLLSEAVFTEKKYDSLLYFGSNFIAGTRVKKAIKFGVIDAQGNEIIPMVYDSVPRRMPIYEVKGDYSRHKATYTVELQEPDFGAILASHTRFAGTILLVHQNGKCGLLGLNNQSILPIEYDTLAENGIDFSWKVNSDYVVVKKNGQYGFVKLAMDNGTKTWSLQDSVVIKFRYLPANYVPDYYKPGFRLIALYRESDFKFMGYANENGLLYFKTD